jgi:hypothetical protein
MIQQSSKIQPSDIKGEITLPGIGTVSTGAGTVSIQPGASSKKILEGLKEVARKKVFKPIENVSP